MLRRIFKGKLTSIALTPDPSSVQLTLLHKTTSVDGSRNSLFQPVVCFVEPSCAEALKIGDEIETIIASDARKIEVELHGSTENNVIPPKIEEADAELSNEIETEIDALRNRNIFSKARNFVKALTVKSSSNPSLE